MQVKILGEVWTVANEAIEIGKLFEKIEGKLENSEHHISHMVIDGTQVFDEYVEYITDRVESIATIEIEVRTAKQLADNLVMSINEYLSRAILHIPDVANRFYSGSDKEAWIELDRLLEGIEWISQALRSLVQSEIKYANDEQFAEFTRRMHAQLTELAAAMSDRDMTLIGDMVRFEIIPLLKTLETEVKKTIDNEVPRNDLN